MTRQRSPSAGGSASLQVGQPFNPFGLFTGIFIPEALVQARDVLPGAKLAYGRLARYAGPDGNCYPSVPTLASELAVSVRQTQKYLAELERIKLIRRIWRISKTGQTSNVYVFLWHPLLEKGVKRTAPEGVTDSASEGVNDRSPKDSQIEESQIEETNIDLDSPSTNRKKRDSRSEFSDALSSRTQHPRLREALADYMMATDEDERVYPGDRLVVDVMDAAAGATEDEVIQCLRYLKDERRLRFGTKNGPRHFSWFKTVVADYFRQKSDREAVNAPIAGDYTLRNGTGLSKEEFDSMTDAIETEGS